MPYPPNHEPASVAARYVLLTESAKPIIRAILISDGGSPELRADALAWDSEYFRLLTQPTLTRTEGTL